MVTIAGWNWVLDLAAFRVPAIRRLLEAKPLVLVRDGRMMRRNLRREMITTDELMAKLREEGVDELADVKLAMMETDGEISVVKKKGSSG